MVVVLAVGAHPDDLELGCSGTLALHKMNGDKVYYLILTKGEASGDPEKKVKESKKAAEIIGVDGLFFGGFEDTKIHDGIETITIIEEVIQKVRPDIVYTHTYRDNHQDHRNAGYATLSAARRCKKVLMYEGPATLRDFVPQVFVDITETFETKKSVTRVFGSQNQKYYLAADAVEGLARHRGYQCGLKVAEAFEVGKFVLGINEFCPFADKKRLCSSIEKDVIGEKTK